MSDSLLKQIIFDCAMELLYKHEGVTNEQIAMRLLNVIKEHDESEEEVID